MTAALSLTDVEVIYRERGRKPNRAVAGVSLEVDRGQIVGLVGESGCGKSTLARAAVGMLEPSAGTITFEGHPVTALSRWARPKELVRLQMVFQNPYSSLNPRRKIGSLIGDSLETSGVERAARRTRTAELLEMVGLPTSAADRFPHQFSGGQRQRVAIARALAADPSVIVLDEPLSSLDASAQAQIANLLVELTRNLGVGLLLISHDLAIVHHVADVVSVMYLGLIVERAPTEELWARPIHPYSEALTQAVPHPDGTNTMPAVLPGEVPDPSRPPSGCRFHPRCAYVQQRCKVDVPELTSVGQGRAAACWVRASAQSVASPN